MGGGEKGIVQTQLGTDLKPVYVDGTHKFTTTKANFDQWYRNVDGVNKPYLVYLVVEPNGIVFTFESEEFFPLDGQGWGNEGFNPDHNFAFTTEVHTTFQYNGGETFSFSGDDDVWVFINGKLAIDLGGLHPVQMDQVSLDAAADMLGHHQGQGLLARSLPRRAPLHRVQLPHRHEPPVRGLRHHRRHRALSDPGLLASRREPPR